MTILLDDFTFDLKFVGVILGILATIETLYLTGLRETTQGVLQRVGKGTQYFFIGTTTGQYGMLVGTTNCMREERQNSPSWFVLTISGAIIVLIVLAINHEPIWLAYPYLQFGNAVSTWMDASLSVPYLPFGVLKGVGFLLWGLIASFFYSLFIIVFLGRSSFLVVEYIATKVSGRLFKLLIAVQVITSSLLLF